MALRILLVMLLFWTSEWTSGQTVEVKIEDEGLVIGGEELSALGRTYYAFKRIPYAAPPVGDLRFQTPRPPLKWEERVLDARKEGSVCAQAANGYDEGDEDCLHLAVYTPKLPTSKDDEKLPVLVWIPGGAFVTGGIKDYSPHLIMDKDIVLVIPQYRLGLLGFFATQSEYGTGNYGLLDQVMALKWVQKNVDKFGGSPDRVILGGDCAGGISSVLHMLSPLSKGLFHGVMSFSGSPLSYWALHPRHMRLGLLISKIVLCPAYDLKIMFECFRERPLNELLDAQKHSLEAKDLLIGNHKLAPAIQEPAYTHESALFLESHPLKLLHRGDFAKVPVFLSVTKDVGAYLVDMALYDFILIKMEEESEFLEKLIKILVKETDILNYKEEEQTFKDYYFSDWDGKEVVTAIPGLIQMLGDVAFKAPILALAKMLSGNVDTRLLRFDYEGGPKLFDARHAGRGNETPPMPGNPVSHGDELYFFLPHERFDFTKEQRQVVDQMLNMIDDFVHGRELLGKWPLFTPEGLETTILTVEGSVQTGSKFVSEEKEVAFLQYIFENQNTRTLNEIKEQESGQKLTHDEF